MLPLCTARDLASLEGDVDEKHPKPTMPSPVRPGMNGADHGAQDAAFDLWLKRGLHAMFDDVAREPLPPELLALIETHRKNSR